MSDENEEDQTYDIAIDKRLLLCLSRIETKYQTKQNIYSPSAFVWITAKMVQKYNV